MSHELQLPEHIETIPGALAFWAGRTRDAPALRAINGRAWTHHELHGAICEIVRRLSSLGVQDDARVALVLPAGVDASIVPLAALSSAIAAPLNSGSTPYELKRDLQRLAPRLIVTGGPTTVGHDVATALDIATIHVGDLLAGDVRAAGLIGELPSRDPDDIAVIPHTSGTKASPKQVPRPHRTYVAAARGTRVHEPHPG